MATAVTPAGSVDRTRSPREGEKEAVLAVQPPESPGKEAETQPGAPAVASVLLKDPEEFVL